jgi:hypothetical protein
MRPTLSSPLLTALLPNETASLFGRLLTTFLWPQYVLASQKLESARFLTNIDCTSLLHLPFRVCPTSHFETPESIFFRKSAPDACVVVASSLRTIKGSDPGCWLETHYLGAKMQIRSWLNALGLLLASVSVLIAAPPPDEEQPASVVKFKQAMEKIRDVEEKRLGSRIAELKKQLRAGARDTKHPVAREAKILARNLAQRLTLVKSGKAFVPRLSPKDFEVGQIGEFDDDLLFSANNPLDGMARIHVMFEELRSENKLANLKAWHKNTVSRPDHFRLRADFIANLQTNGRDYERMSQTNQILRSHVYEIMANESPGGFILIPFKTDEVEEWLKKDNQQKK